MDEKALLYTIWLNQSCGHEPSRIHRMLKKYQTPENVFSANHFDQDFIKTIRLKRLLSLDKTLDSAKRFLEQCQKQEIQLLSIDDKRYPERLKQMFLPPTLLYAKGKLPDLNRMLGVAIVGTRKPTKEGEAMAGALGRDLAKNGVCVVSGMALGIDGAAHCGALEAGGPTLAVLAGGVDVIYPTLHSEMYQHILTHGAVLSEQPPQTVGKPNFYRERNRIIVGLSAGVVVVEGEQKSGSSMTARLATEGNRDLFAVPGTPMNPMAALPNELLRDGAKQTTGALDILEEYLELYPDNLTYGLSLQENPVVGKVDTLNHPPKTPEPISKKKEKPTFRELQHRIECMIREGEFREEEKILLRYLSQKEDTVTFDELTEVCQIPTAQLGGLLIILQMKGLVQQRAGGQYCIQPE